MTRRILVAPGEESNFSCLIGLMKDGQMLSLSNELVSMLSHIKPESYVLVNGKAIHLYLGEASDRLRDCGLLNVIWWDGDSALGFGVAELESCYKSIKFQEAMKKLNSSEIVGLSQGEGKICLQHWDGFMTELDADSMEVMGQQFTK
jgi:hypothetical protein